MMKIKKGLDTILFVLLVAMAILGGCVLEHKLSAVNLKVENLVVSSEGGTASVDYTIESPLIGSSISAAVDVTSVGKVPPARGSSIDIKI